MIFVMTKIQYDLPSYNAYIKNTNLVYYSEYSLYLIGILYIYVSIVTMQIILRMANEFIKRKLASNNRDQYQLKHQPRVQDTCLSKVQ